MATSYQEINEFFLRKISDYSYVNLTQAELEDHLKGYMISAITKFRHSQSDLTDRDNALNQFNQTLADNEKEIISTLMVVEYLSNKVVTSDLIKQSLSNKDWKIYSQANHIEELRKLRQDFYDEASHLITDYTYGNGSLGDLK